MSETLVLIYRGELHTDQLREALAGDVDALKIHDMGLWFSVESSNAIVHVVPIDDLSANGIFENWNSEDIPEGTISVFSLDYRNPEFALTVARKLARLGDLLVDSNFGWHGPIEKLTSARLQWGGQE